MPPKQLTARAVADKIIDQYQIMHEGYLITELVQMYGDQRVEEARRKGHLQQPPMSVAEDLK